MWIDLFSHIAPAYYSGAASSRKEDSPTFRMEYYFDNIAGRRILVASLESVTADIAALPEGEMKQLPLYVQFGIKDEQKRLAHIVQTFTQKVEALTRHGQAGVRADAEASYRKELSLLVTGYQKTLKVLASPSNSSDAASILRLLHDPGAAPDKVMD